MAEHPLDKIIADPNPDNPVDLWAQQNPEEAKAWFDGALAYLNRPTFWERLVKQGAASWTHI